MDGRNRTRIIRLLIEESMRNEPYRKIQEYIGPGMGSSHLKSMIRELEDYEFEDQQIDNSIKTLRKDYQIIADDDDTVMGGTENEPSIKRSRHDHPRSPFSTPLRQSTKGNRIPSRTSPFRGSGRGLSPPRRHFSHHPVTNFTIPPSSSTLSSSDHGIADLFGGLTLKYDENDGIIQELVMTITEKDADTILRDLTDKLNIDFDIVKSVKKDTETLEMESTNNGGDKDVLTLSLELNKLTSTKVSESKLLTLSSYIISYLIMTFVG